MSKSITLLKKITKNLTESQEPYDRQNAIGNMTAALGDAAMLAELHDHVDLATDAVIALHNAATHIDQPIETHIQGIHHIGDMLQTRDTLDFLLAHNAIADIAFASLTDAATNLGGHDDVQTAAIDEISRVLREPDSIPFLKARPDVAMALVTTIGNVAQNPAADYEVRYTAISEIGNIARDHTYGHLLATHPQLIAQTANPLGRVIMHATGEDYAQGHTNIVTTAMEEIYFNMAAGVTRKQDAVTLAHFKTLGEIINNDQVAPYTRHLAASHLYYGFTTTMQDRRHATDTVLQPADQILAVRTTGDDDWNIFADQDIAVIDRNPFAAAVNVHSAYNEYIMTRFTADATQISHFNQTDPEVMNAATWSGVKAFFAENRDGATSLPSRDELIITGAKRLLDMPRGTPA